VCAREETERFIWIKGEDKIRNKNKEKVRCRARKKRIEKKGENRVFVFFWNLPQI
jgi:hypothetical protein